MMKSLASSFFRLGRIRTTEARAKELRPFVEKMLTRANGTRRKQTRTANGHEQTRTDFMALSDTRYFRRYFSERVVKKIMERAKELGERSGGYTRIAKAGRRNRDGAKMAVIEFVK